MKKKTATTGLLTTAEVAKQNELIITTLLQAVTDECGAEASMRVARRWAEGLTEAYPAEPVGEA